MHKNPKERKAKRSVTRETLLFMLKLAWQKKP